MLAAYLPGNSTVRLAEVERPVPGPGQVLLAMKASTICGSDLRAIYREHLGEGPEAYQGVVGGHEPAGQVIEVGPGVHRLGVGARVVVYHISGCGQCDECRRGYQISCTSPLRAAYGWQRDGGHADVLLAEERDLLELPDSLSYLDGACVACGFGTAYEALCRVDLSGRDRLLITGLGPVGLAVGLLAKKMGASQVVGTDPSPERRASAERLGAVDVAVAGTDEELTGLLGDGAEVAIDCSGAGAGAGDGDPAHPPLGSGRAGRRGRPADRGRQRGADPPPADRARLLGVLDRADGRAAGPTGPLGSASRRSSSRTRSAWPRRARRTRWPTPG